MERLVVDHDEVALLPPFSGGSGVVPSLAEREEAKGLSSFSKNCLVPGGGTGVRLQRGPFSLDAEIRRVKALSTRVGAGVAFTGTVRDLSYGQAVFGITVDVYPKMALQALRRIRDEVVHTHSLLTAQFIVRQGRLAISDDLILIMTASEHRRAAFAAAQWCIDEVKRSVPIWKCELTGDGWKWVTHGC